MHKSDKSEGLRKFCISILPEDIFRSAIPVVYLRTKQINSYRYDRQKHNYIYVTYKVLVYVQKSQPTKCFVLFQLGHLQFGHKGRRNYTERNKRDLVPPDFNDNIAFYIVPLTFMSNLKMA